MNPTKNKNPSVLLPRGSMKGKGKERRKDYYKNLKSDHPFICCKIQLDADL